MSAAEPRPILLIVECDADMAAMLSIWLEQAGFGVLRASSGTDALRVALASSPPIAVVITAIGLPDMDGCEMVRRLRQTPSTHAARIIALTAWVNRRDEAMLAGCDGFFAKPSDPALLIAAMVGGGSAQATE